MGALESYVAKIKDAFLTVGRAADAITRDASPRWRPFLRVGFVGSVSLMLLATVPVWPFVWWRQGKWFKKYEQDLEPVSKLEAQARRLWVDLSPQAAIDAIRDAFDRSKSSPSGVVIEPFGRFEWPTCSRALADLLYRFEVEVGHWDKALEVAELLFSENRDAEAVIPTWVLSRARCLVRLRRETEAIALLMEHRDLYNPKAPVNLYLEEVRSGRG